MDSSAIDISLYRLALAYIMGFIVFILINYKKLELNKHLLIGISRMTIQLAIVGFIFKYIFEIKFFVIVAAIFLFMSYNAMRTIIKRTGISFPYVQYFVFAGVTAGPGLVLIFFITVLISPTPWFDPRYFIPIAGMILGNSMNGSALALERFFDECRKNYPHIRTLISLGAKPKEASEEAFRKAYKASLLPTMTSISSMGIVSLPGMMTGQIIGGSAPLVAIKYQIAIMLAIMCSTSLAAFIVLTFEQKQLFDQYGLVREKILFKQKQN